MVFLRRLGMAMEEKDSVDGLMLEVAEAVAEHWRNVWVYYLVLAMGWMAAAFFFILPSSLRQRVFCEQETAAAVRLKNINFPHITYVPQCRT
jgi:hypothetical protein